MQGFLIGFTWTPKVNKMAAQNPFKELIILYSWHQVKGLSSCIKALIQHFLMRLLKMEEILHHFAYPIPRNCSVVWGILSSARFPHPTYGPYGQSVHQLTL